jgi:hypothetical protein
VLLLYISRIGLSRLRGNFWKYEFFLTFFQDSLDGGSAHRKASAYTGQHDTEMRTRIFASSGIRTHNPSVRAVQNHTSLRPSVHLFCKCFIIKHLIIIQLVKISPVLVEAGGRMFSIGTNIELVQSISHAHILFA